MVGCICMFFFVEASAKAAQLCLPLAEFVCPIRTVFYSAVIRHAIVPVAALHFLLCFYSKFKSDNSRRSGKVAQTHYETVNRCITLEIPVNVNNTLNQKRLPVIPGFSSLYAYKKRSAFSHLRKYLQNANP